MLETDQLDEDKEIRFWVERRNLDYEVKNLFLRSFASEKQLEYNMAKAI